jgi:Flp pilus assembly protein TadB
LTPIALAVGRNCAITNSGDFSGKRGRRNDGVRSQVRLRWLAVAVGVVGAVAVGVVVGVAVGVVVAVAVVVVVVVAVVVVVNQSQAKTETTNTGE